MFKWFWVQSYRISSISTTLMWMSTLTMILLLKFSDIRFFFCVCVIAIVIVYFLFPDFHLIRNVSHRNVLFDYAICCWWLLFFWWGNQWLNAVGIFLISTNEFIRFENPNIYINKFVDEVFKHQIDENETNEYRLCRFINLDERYPFEMKQKLQLLLILWSAPEKK